MLRLPIFDKTRIREGRKHTLKVVFASTKHNRRIELEITEHALRNLVNGLQLQWEWDEIQAKLADVTAEETPTSTEEERSQTAPEQGG